MMQLSDNEMLLKLANHPEILSFILKLEPHDLSAFKTMLGMSDSLLANLTKVDVLSWLNSIQRCERDSFNELIDIDPVLLSKFRNNTEHLRVLHRFWKVIPNRKEFLDAYLSMIEHPAAAKTHAIDAFSQGQLDSKLWLIRTLIELDLNLGNVWILCGWVGVLGYLMILKKDKLNFKKIRSFDIDPNCHFLAEQLNRLAVKDNWLYKASIADVNNLDYSNGQYETLRYDNSVKMMTDKANTVINTSCDHMGSNNAWFDSIPPAKVVVLQNNNWKDNEQHDNTVSSLVKFKDRYRFTKLLYAGELDCQIYTRYMLIGIK